MNIELIPTIIKTLCPYILILVTVKSPDMPQEIRSMIIGGSFALMTQSTFTQKKDGTTIIDSKVSSNDIGVIEEVSSEYKPDDTWR